MKKLFLFLAVLGSLSAFAFKDGDFVIIPSKPKNILKSVSPSDFSYDYVTGHLYYKGREFFCSDPGCISDPCDLGFSIDGDVANISCALCGSCWSFSEAELDDYAWGVADDMSASPFLSDDQVNPDSEYHGTKNLSGASGDPSSGDSSSSGSSSDDLIPDLFSIQNLIDLSIIFFGSFIGVVLGGFVVFLCVRRSLVKMKSIDVASK